MRTGQVYLVEIPLNAGPLDLFQTLFTEGRHFFHLISRGLRGTQRQKGKERS